MSKVLIVDDEFKNLYLLKVLLSTNGYEIVSAANGAEALDLARQDLPDVIVSDILMPVMDGFSLCRACKQDERLSSIPFIFYTATYTDSKDEELALSLGAERFIVKPAEPVEFLAILKETVEKFSAIKQASAKASISDTEYYQEYAKALVRKLEDKVAELEQANQALAEDITRRQQVETKLRQQTARAEALVNTANRLNANLDLAEVLNVICEEIAQTIVGVGVAVYMLDQTEETLHVAAQRGLPPSFNLRQAVVPTNAFDWFASVDRPVVFPDVQAVSAMPWANQIREFDIRGVAAACLLHQDTRFGYLLVFSLGQARHFDADELAFLEVLNHQASQAIHNASLFQRIERHLKNIESLRQIDLTIANSYDVHLALDVLVNEVTTQLGVDAAAVFLYQSTSKTLEYAVGRGFRTFEMKDRVLSLGESLAGRIAQERQPLHIPDLSVLEQDFPHAGLFRSEGFVTYFGAPLVAKGKIIGVLEVFHRDVLHPDLDWLNFLDTLAGQAAIAIDSIQSFEQMQISSVNLVLAYNATIEGWARAMDLRDEETEGHTRRVTRLTLQLAQKMGVSEEEQLHMWRGSLLHDMGKLGIPDRILHKPDKLTEDEWVIMRQHPEYAYEMLKSIEYLRPALDIPYCHHEKWDGSGYPRGLKGVEIPLAARIFSVVDVWDALTSDRPYRGAWSNRQALAYIREQSGVHFDPVVVSAFLAIMHTSPLST